MAFERVCAKQAKRPEPDQRTSGGKALTHSQRE